MALTALLQEWLDKARASEKELASLAVFAGRLFLNRVLATKRRAARLKHPIYLEEAFRDDVEWWLEDLQIRNGVSFLVHKFTSDISLDASTIMRSMSTYQCLPLLNFTNYTYPTSNCSLICWWSESGDRSWNALTRPGSEKHRRMFEKISREAGVTPRRRDVSPEMFEY